MSKVKWEKINFNSSKIKIRNNLGETVFLKSTHTAWNVAKYGVFSGPYFPVFGLNTGNYGPEKSLYLDTFHAVKLFSGVYRINHRSHSV